MKLIVWGVRDLFGSEQADQPGPGGKFDYEKLEYLTSCLKETLRLKTYSIAWRHVKEDTTLTSEPASARKVSDSDN